VAIDTDNPTASIKVTAAVALLCLNLV